MKGFTMVLVYAVVVLAVAQPRGYFGARAWVSDEPWEKCTADAKEHQDCTCYHINAFDVSFGTGTDGRCPTHT